MSPNFTVACGMACDTWRSGLLSSAHNLQITVEENHTSTPSLRRHHVIKQQGRGFEHPRSSLTSLKEMQHIARINHRRAVAQHCINGDSLSQWRRAKFDPTESRPLNRLPKNLAQLITSGRRPPVPDFVQIRPRISCKSVHVIFHANAWNITKTFNGFSRATA